MALYLIGGGDGADPVDATQIDLAQAGNVCNHPVWLSFRYWTEVPDLLAGGFTMYVNYEDPTGTIRQIVGTTLNLTDGASEGGSDGVKMIIRKDLIGRFTLDWESPLPGSAVIGWRVMLTGNLDESTQSLVMP